MDFLRGLAIAIMIIDHIYAYILSESVSIYNIRLITRIAEPLFALLLGYFLIGRKRERIFERGFQITAAAIISNIIHYPATLSLEILASFVIVYIVYWIMKERFKYLIFIVLFSFLDPTRTILSYPAFLVISQVSLGMLLRKKEDSWIHLLVFAFAIPIFAMSTSLTLALTSIFTILAFFMIKIAEENHEFGMNIINWIGRNPLKIYVAQMYIIIGMRIVLEYLEIV